MKRIFALFASIAYLAGNAQETDSTAAKPQFKLSINYNSNLNYYGRTDDVKSTGVFPLAELWFSPKFYINAAPVFINNKVQSFEYAGTIATAGYQSVTDKWITSVSVLKPFYKENVQLVQSALQAQGSLSISRLTKVINLTVGGDAKYSDKMDFGVSAGLDHTIRMEGKNGSVWVIDPSAYLYAGTQNFSNTYTKKKAGSLLFPGSSEQVTEHVQQFNTLAYEASLPLIYVKDKWMVMATPSYILPQNLITVPNRPDLSEKGENMFYITLALKRTF
jgi:hypothetical protein